MTAFVKIPALLTAFLVILTGGPASADDAQKPLELTQIFGPAAVSLERRPALEWMADGNAYTALEPSKSTAGGIDVVRYDIGAGSRSAMVSAAALIPAGASKPLGVTSYAWSPDGRLLLLQIAAPEARRNNPIGDCWLLDLKSRSLRRLGGSLPPASLLYAEFSPDSRRVAYVSGNNLYSEPTDGSKPVALTADGNDLLLNGRAELAYEEEFSLGKAFRWSPDSRRIVYWQFDTSGVGTFFLIRNTDGQYSTPVPQRYPKPGTTNSAVKVGVVSADTPGTTWAALPGDPRNNYVPRVDWAGNSASLLIQHENRPQNTNNILIGDAMTGAVQPLMVERDAAWLLPNEAVRWLDRGRAFTWLSERDGWMHLYVVSRDGKQVRLRTPGDFDIEIKDIDEKSGYAYFIASPGNVTQRYLYRATLAGPVKIERLTPAAAAGTHGYDLAPGARWAVHTFSRADQPPQIDVVRLPSHERQRLVTDNPKMNALLAGTARGVTEFFKVDIGGAVLDAWMIKPADFDPAKKYPLLMYVYSEPAGQTVVDAFGGDRYLWHLLLAQRGYLVASVDSRGSAAPRGHDWRRSIYRQIGILASADQAAAVRKMIAERPYIDPARVGVWGWSGGGAMTLNAMFRYPELYATGIAVASPVDQMLYNSIYQERYMGLPADNPDGYRDGSPINFARNLKGNLLIIHGTGDDNVHYQNAEQLADRLIGLNKPFSMMAYPNRSHGIHEGANTRLHLFSLATRYLEEHLPRGNPP
jgi:dipeptidyl-peptidase-4